jgi:hypothetical protein
MSLSINAICPEKSRTLFVKGRKSVFYWISILPINRRISHLNKACNNIIIYEITEIQNFSQGSFDYSSIFHN